MKIYFFALTFILVLVGCQQNETEPGSKVEITDKELCPDVTGLHSAEYEKEHKDNIALVREAIETNNDALFDNAASWFVNSWSPMEFIPYANLMALKNNSATAYYAYFYFYDANTKIEATDAVLIEHLKSYLRKAIELGWVYDSKSIEHTHLFSEENL